MIQVKITYTADIPEERLAEWEEWKGNTTKAELLKEGIDSFLVCDYEVVNVEGLPE
jgi:hypothetical protein